MGPAKQFVLGIPDFNADRQMEQFYNFGNSDDENARTVEDHSRNPELDLDSDQDSNRAEESTIVVDDPGLQVLLREKVLLSQPE